MLKDNSIEEFLDELSSSSPSPGGGAVAALLAGLSTSLASMMANLTTDKKGYEGVSRSSKELAERMQIRKKDFLLLMDRDANSFDSVIEAFKLPKETEEEKEIRSREIQRGYAKAIKVPLEIAEKSLELFEDINYIVDNGNKNLITDGIAAAMAASTAVNMALLNVKINLKSIKGKKYADNLYYSETYSRMIDIEVAATGYLAKICSKSGLQF